MSAEAFDIMAELEAVRSAPDPRSRVFTKEQDEFMWAARGSNVSRNVPYDDMIRLWNMKWGSSPNCETMRKRIVYLKEQGGPK